MRCYGYESWGNKPDAIYLYVTMATVVNADKFSPYFLPLVASIFVLVIAQDYVHALLRDYNFYLSESLLFGGI